MKSHHIAAAAGLIAALISTSAPAVTFVSSRPQPTKPEPVYSDLPDDVPKGAIVLKVPVAEMLHIEEKTVSCTDIYGDLAKPYFFVTGGPITMSRMQTAYEQYTAWTRTDGTCIEHVAVNGPTETTPCQNGYPYGLVQHQWGSYRLVDDTTGQTISEPTPPYHDVELLTTYACGDLSQHY